VLRLDTVAPSPAAFVSLTGLTPAEFENPFTNFHPAYRRYRAAADTTRRGRAPGAGGRHAHDLRGHLLLAVVWLKVYPTYEVLGLLFGLNKGNARRNMLDIPQALDTFDSFPFDRPDGDPAHRPLRSAEEVLAAFPQVWLVIDSREQRV
jgi:hypothetical protein